MTAPSRFSQADVTRALKAAKSAGFPRVRVTLDLGGNLVLDVSDETPLPTIRSNPLDRILDR